MPTQTAVSFEEFLALPEEVALSYEYVDGELVEVATGSVHDNFLRDVLTHRLLAWWIDRRIGWVISEHVFRLPNGRAYRPDVAWLRERPANLSWLEQCPDLPIEIVSPSDTAEHVERKVTDYLANGAVAVWIVWPEDRVVTIRHGTEVKRLTIADMLADESLLPGFSLPLAELFIL